MEIIDAELKFSGDLKPITGKIEKLIQHHMAHPTWGVQQVHNYHRDGNGWLGIGYNYFISFDGTIYQGRGRNVGAHAGPNWNGRSLGIGYQGNFEEQQMTDAQLKSGAWLNAKLIREEGLRVQDIIGHSDASATRCPGQYFRMIELRLMTEKLLKGGEQVVGTPITGLSKVTAQQAQEWARNRRAHQRFIDIAPVYWACGEQSSIRPEVLYAQAAKETAFGHYKRPNGTPGAVKPEMNNWAGIKTRRASGDRKEDHKTFASPEDGVRGHFNHMSAYVGLEPMGEPHGRYFLVLNLDWAGTIRTVEQLGGKWAPAGNYGQSIVEDYLDGLLATSEPQLPPDKECSQCVWLEEDNARLKREVLELSSQINVLIDRMDRAVGLLQNR